MVEPDCSVVSFHQGKVSTLTHPGYRLARGAGYEHAFLAHAALPHLDLVRVGHTHTLLHLCGAQISCGGALRTRRAEGSVRAGPILAYATLVAPSV